MLWTFLGPEVGPPSSQGGLLIALDLFRSWFSQHPLERELGGLVCFPNKVGNQIKEKPKKIPSGTFRFFLSNRSDENFFLLF